MEKQEKYLSKVSLECVVIMTGAYYILKVFADLEKFIPSKASLILGGIFVCIFLIASFFYYNKMLMIFSMIGAYFLAIAYRKIGFCLDETTAVVIMFFYIFYFLRILVKEERVFLLITIIAPISLFMAVFKNDPVFIFLAIAIYFAIVLRNL